MNKTILIFLAITLISSAVTLPLGIVNAQPQDYTLIAFAGDWSCNGEATDSFAQVGNSGASLLAILGDTTYGSGLGCFDTLIRDNNLQGKVIAAMGNHDMDFEAEMKEYFNLPDTGYKTFEFVLGSGVGAGKAVFIILNTEDGAISKGSVQYNWLDSTLKSLQPRVDSGEVKYVIPIMHAMGAWNCGSGCGDHGIESYAGDLRSLFLSYGNIIDTVLQGHDHNFMISKPLAVGDTVTTTDNKDSITFFVNGLAGRSPDSANNADATTLEAFGGSSNHGVSYMKLYHDESKIDTYFQTNSGTVKAQHLILGDTVVPPKEICNDGIDNDGDGLIDIADPDCQSKEICNDGIDNDGDGLTDIDDPDCKIFEEICNNGIDDDGDGLIDENCGTGGDGKLTPVSVVASAQDSGKEADKAADGDMTTRWSGNGDGQTIEFTFNGTYPVTQVGLTGYHYDKTYNFEISGKQFTNDAGREQGKLIMYDLSDLGIDSDKVKITGHGNSNTSYNSYREIQFFTDSTVPLQELCGNNTDDDKDGLIDEDCPAELCYDNIDNDGDGAVDENCPFIDPLVTE